MRSLEEAGGRCTIIVAELFAMISAQRKLLKRPPVEERAMASRCTLRFNIDRQEKVDFNAEQIVLSANDMKALEKVVNEQFGLYFDGELSRLCVKPEKPVEAPVHTTLPFEEYDLPWMEPEKTGLMSKIKRLFGGK